MVLVLVTTASGRFQQIPARRRGGRHVISPHVTLSLDDEKEIAGLAKGSKPGLTGEVFTSWRLSGSRGSQGRFWKRSTGRLSRAKANGSSGRLCPVPQRLRVWCQFPVPDGTIRALGPPSQAINVRSHLALLESLTKLLQERIQGESSGLSWLDIDNVSRGAGHRRARKTRSPETAIPGRSTS